MHIKRSPLYGNYSTNCTQQFVITHKINLIICSFSPDCDHKELISCLLWRNQHQMNTTWTLAVQGTMHTSSSVCTKLRHYLAPTIKQGCNTITHSFAISSSHRSWALSLRIQKVSTHLISELDCYFRPRTKQQWYNAARTLAIEKLPFTFSYDPI